ncbi:MAG: hypothetical protein LBR81_00825 [Prevotellaceae bacterium]|jgi:putative Mn2+ efflux pump MntP|nr:hypothetical protein [Prevotellaceae bacterium]
MWQLFVGSLVLSVIHAAIPNHWLPFIIVAKAEHWSTRESLWASFIAAFFHLLSNIVLGVIVGFVGIQLFARYESAAHIVAPLILIILGAVYVFLDVSRFRSQHKHELHIDRRKSKTAIIVSLAAGMFFSPCLELEAYYLQAAKFGVAGIASVSAVYMLVTLPLILGLVYLGLKGINRFDSRFMEQHGKLISGLALILLGIISFFVEV